MRKLTLQEQIDCLSKEICKLKKAGNEPVITAHNLLTGKQGGNDLLNEFYHLDKAQYDNLLKLFYINYTYNYSLTPTTGERGVTIPLNAVYTVTPNDDIITSLTIDGNPTTADGLPHVMLLGNIAVTAVKNMVVSFTRNGTPMTETIPRTYTAYPPQWSGVSANSSLQSSLSYGLISSVLTKVVQSSTEITRNLAPANEYVWFVSTNPSAVITNSGFPVTIGAWGDPSTFFWKLTATLTLANGTTTSSLTFYRTRELLTHATQQYKIV